MKIKALKVERPFKLTQLADYFDIQVIDLEEQLSELADTKKIFQHDIKEVPSDVLLSQFAITFLILHYHLSTTNLKRLDYFVEKYSNDDAPGAYLARLFIYGNILHEKVETLQLQQETSEIKRDNGLLDEIIEFAPIASVLMN